MGGIPERYLPERVEPAEMGRWLSWSLDFFTQPVPQTPYLDITLQQDVTAEYQRYREESPAAGSFFAFMVWHLARTLAGEPSANLRFFDGRWYRLHNPPVFVPVAVGGERRFGSLLLEDIQQRSLPDFLDDYARQLDIARSPQGNPPVDSMAYRCAHFIGNLPYLRFTGLNLHWRLDQLVGQCCFYFGQRYEEGGRLMQPLAVKLHHACMDPLVFDGLMQSFRQRFVTA